MCPGGYPIQESQNWQAGFLPGVYQGTYIDSSHTRIEKLIEHIRNNYTTQQEQRQQLDLLQQLNERHQRQLRRLRSRDLVNHLLELGAWIVLPRDNQRYVAVLRRRAAMP